MFTVYDTICEILSEQLEIPLDEITAESKLRDDLSADSLDLIDLAMTLEDEFRKEVPDEALEKMKTVGDVVAFLPNGNENSHYYVKRVVAGPGDKVRIADGTLYVNGQESKWVTERILDAGIAENEIILGNKEYFCIGDNPNNSEDSRSANIGPVEEGDMIGKAWFHLKSGTDGIGFIK